MTTTLTFEPVAPERARQLVSGCTLLQRVCRDVRLRVDDSGLRLLIGWEGAGPQVRRRAIAEVAAAFARGGVPLRSTAFVGY